MKPWYKSRTLWANVIGVVLAVVSYETKQHVIPDQVAGAILFVLNVLLRFDTDKSIG